MPVWLIVYLSILGVCTLEIIIEYAVYDCARVSNEFFDDPGFKMFVYTPKDIYSRTEMNWFGCIFCYVLLIIFTPHLLLLKWIVQFSYWIFHTGRCNNCRKCRWFKLEEIPNGVRGICTKK